MVYFLFNKKCHLSFLSVVPLFFIRNKVSLLNTFLIIFSSKFLHHKSAILQHFKIFLLSLFSIFALRKIHMHKYFVIQNFMVHTKYVILWVLCVCVNVYPRNGMRQRLKQRCYDTMIGLNYNFSVNKRRLFCAYTAEKWVTPIYSVGSVWR